MKVDPHAGEPTVPLDPVTYRDYMQAKENADAWDKEAKRLQALLDEQLGDAYAGTVDGRKLVTHRPINKYRTVDLINDYPDLTQHYMKPVYQDAFDLDAFVRDHPEKAEPYRSRQFRSLADV